ncbi:uncharacterized protein SPPG_05768 [Spizellomyces punctatus DAOM BR117]|uniref:Uncharacterized protein n=1 Tax=Spizellomyces punctatus (strain DAOM BR117) TaxID=645134 RepID=A0A0L0HCT2_SPIPD|nr:uncharacterized protein SPPG_05768 [Spizellomyces punctatus DAOM BR117]KNC98791.1 hypothetical protein SPPG_05768 [Spizellomyces punctatus DAOM BR117]|eukprot:XP_016606831.1 hypothetical protein SPPG_05768 [Spizellomyces punctatus DAOM BR117]
MKKKHPVPRFLLSDLHFVCNMPRRTTALYFAIGATIGVVANHYRHIRSVPNPPDNFRSLVTAGSTWGLYHRRLDRPIVLSPEPTTSALHSSDSSPSPNTSLNLLVKSILTSTPYKLELALSSPSESSSEFDLCTGSKIGYLSLESLPSSNEAIFHYEYPGIDFRMYISTPTPRDILLGFVDYSGSLTQDVGSRVYTRMLCESAARMLEKGVWDSE